MPTKRKKGYYTPKQFESQKGAGDTSANLFRSMLLHPAFQSLETPAKVLYVYCKSEYYGSRRDDKNEFPEEYRNDRQYFTMNWSKCKRDGLYGLYSKNIDLIRDITRLIEHGFIDCVVSGADNKRKNLYKFSDRWQKWGTPEFELPTSVMTKHMLEEFRKSTNKEGQ